MEEGGAVGEMEGMEEDGEQEEVEVTGEGCRPTRLALY